MGAFANDPSPRSYLNSLRADNLQPFLQLLQDAELFYSAKLLNLNPNDFKSLEEFTRKWQFYKGAIEAVRDLNQLIKGQ